MNETTRDEHSLKSGGVLAALEKFSILSGLRLGYLLFGAAEETSTALQAKDTSVQEALSSVQLTEALFKRQRTEECFNSFCMLLLKVLQENWRSTSPPFLAIPQAAQVI